MEELEIYIENALHMHAVKIYFVMRRNGKSSLGKIIENGNIEFKEFNEGESVDNPTMVMDIHYFQIFGKAMLKALEERNIEPEEKSFVKGKFEATKYHLEDLRLLLKLKDNNE